MNRYVLECTRADVLVRVLLNDVPLVNEESGPFSQATVALNPWLVLGPNELRILLAWPGAHAEAPDQSSVAIAVRDPSLGEPLLRFHWPPSGADASAARALERARRRRRHEAVLELTTPRPPETTFWQGAAPLVLDPAATEAVLAIVVELQDAVDTWRFGKVIDLLGYRSEELARAFGVERGYVLSELSLLLLTSLPEEVVTRLPEIERIDEAQRPLPDPDTRDQLEAHLVGHDKLVWVTRAGFAPAVRTRGPQCVRLPIYLAPRGGRWTIVR